MMRLRRAVGVGVLLFAAAVCSAGGQGGVSPVMAQPGSVRGVGLNGSNGSLMGNAGSVFTHPPGIATIRHIAVEGQFRTAPGEAYLASAAVAWRLRQFDIGLGARRFDYGGTPAQYLPGATGDARDQLGSATLIYRWGFIAFGGTGKYMRREVAGVRTDGVSGDLGLAIAIFDIMGLAFAVQNVAGNWRDTSSLAMPRITRLSAFMNYVDPQESFRLLSTAEIQWPEGGSARLALGAEAGIVLGGVGIIARAGYGGRNAWLAPTSLTYGATLHMSVWNVDYAYRKTDLLGRPAHYLGTRFTL